MVKNVGKIIISRQNRVLEYYVFGNEKTGFGIRIYTTRYSECRSRI